jgi:hypothetical protein
MRFTTPEGLARHGLTIQAAKEWRQKEREEGRPSGFEDFLRAYRLCIECRGEGALVIGIRWRDAEGIERAERGPVGDLLQHYSLDNPAKWLTEKLKWK